MADVVAAVLLLTGAFFILLAAVGVLRMPDLFTRMSCSTKAATLGVILSLCGAAVHFDDLAVGLRAGAGALFLLVTAPIAAQMIGRAAYFVGVPLWTGTLRDELKEHARRRER